MGTREATVGQRDEELETTGVRDGGGMSTEVSRPLELDTTAAGGLAERMVRAATGTPGDAFAATLRGAPAEPPVRSEPGEADEPEEPRQIDRFTVLRRLGAGGMGVVYAAFDEQLDRKVAIKVLRPEHVGDTQGRARMLREAQAMAQLSHPNVVHAYEVGEFAGEVFIAMEFVRGRSLKEWLVEPRTFEEIIEVFVQAGHGLAAAHRQGLVHRDFKPENVLIDGDGHARVLDFGLARASRVRVDAGSSLVQKIDHRGSVLAADLTLDGMLVGTPAYMSPEQFENLPTDWRSDQFSFCVALYGAVYGQPPFAGETLIALQTAVCEGALQRPPPGTKAPPWLFAVLETGLAVDPEQRHPSMDTLLAALEPERAGGRRWLWPAVTLGATIAAVLVTLLLVRPGDPTEEQLQAIARHAREAREAAAEMHWVYPPPEDRKDTAYHRVTLLEAFDGPPRAQASAAADELRSECAASLVALGDRNWDDPATRPFARDFYAQALLFSPLDGEASSRAGVTVGQLADLQQRAASGEFFADELVAAEPLRILAEPDPVRARTRALAFADSPEHGAALGLHVDTVLRKAGVVPAPAPEPEPPVVAEAPVVVAEPEPPPVVAEPPVTPPPGPTKQPRTTPTKQVSPPTPPPPEPPATEDPVDTEGSNKLADEGSAALRSGEHDRAEKLFKQALNLWPDNAVALMGLSDIAYDDGRYPAAIKHGEAAVRQAPRNTEYLLRLGDAYVKALMYDRARERYQRAAELGHPRAGDRLKRVEAELGK